VPTGATLPAGIVIPSAASVNTQRVGQLRLGGVDGLPAV
jgi:hypothetical protein